MHTFLSSEGFKGLTRSFGWVPVHTGIVHTLRMGNLHCQPHYATLEQISIVPHTDIPDAWHDEEQHQAAVLRSLHAFLTLSSFDPASWTLVRFTLWEQVPEEERLCSGIQCLTLLHLSAPRLVTGNV